MQARVFTDGVPCSKLNPSSWCIYQGAMERLKLALGDRISAGAMISLVEGLRIDNREELCSRIADCVLEASPTPPLSRPVKGALASAPRPACIFATSHVAFVTPRS